MYGENCGLRFCRIVEARREYPNNFPNILKPFAFKYPERIITLLI